MNWLPYPKNKPKKDGEYLVTIGSYVTIADFKIRSKKRDMFNEFSDIYYVSEWQDVVEGGTHENVTAFMEKPKCYKKSD